MCQGVRVGEDLLVLWYDDIMPFICEMKRRLIA